MNKYLLGLLTLFSISISVKAIMWLPAPKVCPNCMHKSEYQVNVSYGDYIYYTPSKYQYIYFPYTDPRSVYCCSKCYYSAYMWDFDSIPANKTDTIKVFLSTVKFDKTYKDYLEIPILKRLEISENIYKILGRDNQFWCQFYRVIAFYYDESKNDIKAKESRQISLKLARDLLTDTLYAGQEKETFYIIAAMHYFIGQKDSSLIYLNKAQILTYKNKNLEEDGVKNVDNYLTAQIHNYKELIRKNKYHELKQKLKLYIIDYWHLIIFSMFIMALGFYLIKKRFSKGNVTTH